MATVNILPAFTYKWAQDGTAEALEDTQYKAGWSFIGATPPSVEQFNKVHQIADEKSNYLYSQLSTIYTLTGVVPGAADVNSLRNALRGTGLFLTAAPGTNDTSVATTAFVQAAGAAMTGRLIRTTRYIRVAGVQNVSVDGGANTTTNATIFTRQASTKFARVRVQAGGSGGAGSTATAGTVGVGAPGSSGSYGESIFDAATIGVGSLTVTVGLGSAGSSGAVGGTSTFGLLMSVPGGTGAGALLNQTPPTLNGNGASAGGPTGANLLTILGSSPNLSIAQSLSVANGGSGGPSLFGAGGNGPVINTNGTNAVNYGSGGSGTVVNNSGGTATGGNGAPGIVIIEEYA